MRHRKTVTWLVLGTCTMFGFAFALVPLYNRMCQALGINGKPSMLVKNYDESHARIDRKREITVEFVATQRPSLPWAFHPNVQRLKVHPGQIAKLSFYAENQSDHSMTVQAIPSVIPGLAAKYIKKTECFCFAKQSLDAHEAMNMPVLFYVEPELPKQFKTITLSYTLFDVTHKN